MRNEERWTKSQLTVEIKPYDLKAIEDKVQVNKYISELVEKLRCNHLITPLVFSSITEDDYTRFLDALEKEGTISPVIENELMQRSYEKEQEGIVGFCFLYEGYIIIRSIKGRFMYTDICLNKDIDDQEIINFINKFWDAKESNVVVAHNLFSKETEMTSKQYKFPKLRIV